LNACTCGGPQASEAFTAALPPLLSVAFCFFCWSEVEEEEEDFSSANSCGLSGWSCGTRSLGRLMHTNNNLGYRYLTDHRQVTDRLQTAYRQVYWQCLFCMHADETGISGKAQQRQEMMPFSLIRKHGLQEPTPQSGVRHLTEPSCRHKTRSSVGCLSPTTFKEAWPASLRMMFLVLRPLIW